jgi:polyisoprenoid-binding protein YceI
MDKNAYNALKTDKFKSIQFTVVSSTIQKNAVQATGNLSIAGITKPVQIEAICSNNNGTLICTGSKKIKMSDFQVEAPVFMFGTVKTGDEITISFNLQLAAVKI